MTTISVTYVEGFSETDKIKANKALKLLENVVNSPEFKSRVLNVRKFRRNKIKRKTGNKRYTNQEIYDLIMSGEDLKNPPDNVINLKIKLYNSEKNEIGHTNMSTLEINTYRGFFNEKDANYYAAHLMHEYMHVVGFTHGIYDIFRRRNKTVPYRIGKIVSQLLQTNNYA